MVFFPPILQMLGMASHPCLTSNILWSSLKQTLILLLRTLTTTRDPTLMASSELNPLPKGPPPNTITLVGVGLHTSERGGRGKTPFTTSDPIQLSVSPPPILLFLDHKPKKQPTWGEWSYLHFLPKQEAPGPTGSLLLLLDSETAVKQQPQATRFHLLALLQLRSNMGHQQLYRSHQRESGRGLTVASSAHTGTV